MINVCYFWYFMVNYFYDFFNFKLNDLSVVIIKNYFLLVCMSIVWFLDYCVVLGIYGSFRKEDLVGGREFEFEGSVGIIDFVVLERYVVCVLK